VVDWVSLVAGSLVSTTYFFTWKANPYKRLVVLFYVAFFASYDSESAGWHSEGKNE
jgi:hypothetical protein